MDIKTVQIMLDNDIDVTITANPLLPAKWTLLVMDSGTATATANTEH